MLYQCCKLHQFLVRGMGLGRECRRDEPDRLICRCLSGCTFSALGIGGASASSPSRVATAAVLFDACGLNGITVARGICKPV